MHPCHRQTLEQVTIGLFSTRVDKLDYIGTISLPSLVGLVVSISAFNAIGCGFSSRQGYTNDHHNKSANALALCHPSSASFCSVLARQWSSRIFTHDRYNILSDILIEFEVNLGIIIEKYAKT